MSKTLYANGVTGRVIIYKGVFDPDVYQVPTGSDLENIYFHSDLAYLANSHVVTATVSHPQRTHSQKVSKGLLGSTTYYNPVQGNQIHVIGANPLSKITPFIMHKDGAQIPGGTVIQQVGQSARAISAQMTAGNLVVYESYVTFDDTLPAMSATYGFFVLDTFFSGSGNESIRIEPDFFKAGFGKLNSKHRHPRRVSSNPDVYLGQGKTADVQGGGTRVVLPDGTIAYDSGYTGAFSGGDAQGVAL